MNTSELFKLAGTIVVLAGVTVVVIYGDRTAGVITAIGNAFSGSLRVATRNTRG